MIQKHNLVITTHRKFDTKTSKNYHKKRKIDMEFMFTLLQTDTLAIVQSNINGFTYAYVANILKHTNTSTSTNHMQMQTLLINLSDLFSQLIFKISIHLLHARKFFLMNVNLIDPKIWAERKSKQSFQFDYDLWSFIHSFVCRILTRLDS